MKIVCLSSSNWYPYPTSKQEIMRRMGAEVLYFDPPVTLAAPLKDRLSPHKLRSTFGTNLYLETGDIYLVADVLGHSDVNTTRKHYADMTDSRRREAAKHVKLPTADTDPK